MVAEGRSNFVEAIKEFEAGDLRARLLEVLCCNGCIMGPGMTVGTPLFSRRSRVSQFVRKRWIGPSEKTIRGEMAKFDNLGLTRTYTADDQRFDPPSRDEIAEILQRIGKESPKGRAQLRRLRLRHLRGPRHRHP